MFLLIIGRHIGGPHGITIQISIKLREMLEQITQKRCTADLRIGEVVKRFFPHNIPSSWPFSFNEFELFFLLRDSETMCSLK